MNNIIIAIDGPAGSGKSTIAKIIAKKFNFTYIDTGAMYRMITLYLLENNITNLIFTFYIILYHKKYWIVFKFCYNSNK